ncbi:MAG: putative Fe-S cluster protein YjdI [Arcticibacterium sp.]|jgi:uncharacterized Fe-S cluster protein YjdI
MGKIKEYPNGEITILWEPDKCIHSGECVKALPEVYDPKARPWLKIEKASTAELKAQIAKCPSAALAYVPASSIPKEKNNASVEIEVMENGPLLAHGIIKIKGKDFKATSNGKVTAFCRCGASGNKPYCDGSHIKSNFKG